jgi:hypothetical protein
MRGVIDMGRPGLLPGDDWHNYASAPHPLDWQNYPATPLERSFTVSATTIGNRVGHMFGEDGRKLAGLCMACKRLQASTADLVYIAFALSWGEIPSGGITDLELNDQPISELSWVLSSEILYGTAAQSISTILNQGMATDGLVETYPCLAYVALKLDASHAEAPASVKFTAVCKGKKVTDYRDASTGESSNPALTMYYLLTNGEYFLGKDTADVATGSGESWRDGADHCDTVMGDSSLRYTFDGYITDRSARRAIETVGEHGFLTVHYVHDRYELCSMECPTGPRSVYIEEDADVEGHLPEFREIARRTTPNEVGVNYTIGQTFENGFVPVTVAGGLESGDELRYIEKDLVGCTSKSQAARWATKYINHQILERFEWVRHLPAAVMADVLPGQVIYHSTVEGVTNQPVRVVGMDGLEDGVMRVRLVEYDGNTDSTLTASEDTPISLDVGVDSSTPDAPTAATQTFIEVGFWEGDSLITDPDSLTAGNNWANASGTDPQVTDNTTSTDLEWPVSGDSWDWAHEFDPGSDDYAMLTLCIRCVANHDDTATVRVYYDSYTGSWSAQLYREILPEDTLLFGRLILLIPLTSGATNHRVRLYGTKSGGSTMELRVRRVHVVPWNEDPRLRVGAARLGLSERWAWTEHSSAADSVLAYQARRQYAFNVLGPIIAEVPQGEDLMEFAVLQGLGGGALAITGGEMIADGLPRSFAVLMIAMGIHGAWAQFPNPTQDFQLAALAAPSGVELTWYRTRDRKTTNSQDASAWSTTGTAPTVTTNVANSPDGSSNTADRIDGGASSGEIQCRDTLPAPSTFPGGEFYQLLWLKSESDDFDLQLGSEFGSSGYDKTVRVRTHWRLFRMLSNVAAAPYPGPSLLTGSSTPNFLATTAVSWQTTEGVDLKEYHSVKWTKDAGAIRKWDRFELQYRLYDMNLKVAGDWLTHYQTGPLATEITWGNHPLAMAPPFPFEDSHGISPDWDVLHDWRVVGIRDDYAVELIPTTISEVEIDSFSSVQELYEYDQSTSGDGELLLLEGTGDSASLVSTPRGRARTMQSDRQLALTDATWATILSRTLGTAETDAVKVFYEVVVDHTVAATQHLMHEIGEVTVQGYSTDGSTCTAQCDTSGVNTKNQASNGSVAVTFQITTSGPTWNLQAKAAVTTLGTINSIEIRYFVVQMGPDTDLGGMGY